MDFVTLNQVMMEGLESEQRTVLWYTKLPSFFWKYRFPGTLSHFETCTF